MLAPFTSDPESEQWVVAHSSRSLTVAKKLYVGNLTYDVSSPDLEQMFSQYGSVLSAQVIMDRDTGRSKGFGFVEMSNESEANAAIGALNDTEHGGRRLTVNEAKPREARTTTYGRGGGGRGPSSYGGRRY
jgi:RNA recognition motif-containing protein